MRYVIIKSIKTGSVCYFHKHLTYSRTRSSKIPTSFWTYPARLTRRSISWTRCLRMFVDYIKIASKISGHKTFQYIQRYINTLWGKQLFVVNSWILIWFNIVHLWFEICKIIFSHTYLIFTLITISYLDDFDSCCISIYWCTIIKYSCSTSNWWWLLF